MQCDYCYPESNHPTGRGYDHGWSLPDVRAVFDVRADGCAAECGCPEDGDTCGTAQIEVVRALRPHAECAGRGDEFTARYEATGPGLPAASFESAHRAERYLRAFYESGDVSVTRDSDREVELRAAAAGRPY